MLNMEQLNAAVDVIALPQREDFKSREEYFNARRDRDLRISEAENEWGVWLGVTHAPSLPEAVRNQLFRKAWDAGHANGYEQVESEYEELATFALWVVQEHNAQ